MHGVIILSAEIICYNEQKSLRKNLQAANWSEMSKCPIFNPSYVIAAKQNIPAQRTVGEMWVTKLGNVVAI